MTRMRLGVFVAGGLLVALLLAFFVSPLASREPDGLDKVAAERGFADQETTHALDGVPTAGYAVEGVDDGWLSTGLAGLIGVAVTFGIGIGLFRLVQRAGRRSDPTLSSSASSA